MNPCSAFLPIVNLIAILLCSCQKQTNNQTKEAAFKITRSDTTNAIQQVLNHKRLDSLLNFAFKGQTLKIVQNNVIQHPLVLTMNGKPVKFTRIDSSNSDLRVYNKPRFFAKITILKMTPSDTKLVIFFESIGLFGEYWLKKDEEGAWKIRDVNFAHT